MKEDNQQGQQISSDDVRIQKEITDRLSEDPKTDAGKMEVEVNNGEVILKGKADTEEEKQHAESIAASVPGVKHVENRLHIDIGIAHTLSVLVAQISADTEKNEGDSENKRPSQ